MEKTHQKLEQIRKNLKDGKITPADIKQLDNLIERFQKVGKMMSW